VINIHHALVHTGGLHRVAAAREALIVTCNAMERFTECTKVQAIGCLVLGWAAKDKPHGMCDIMCHVHYSSCSIGVTV
jgi:hypothetical protein